MSANILENKTIIQDLESATGADHVLTGDADREFYAMDVYSFREMPIAVVQPGTVEELQTVARIASQVGRCTRAARWGCVVHGRLSAKHAEFVVDRHRRGWTGLSKSTRKICM